MPKSKSTNKILQTDANVQVEIVYISILAAHHLTGGGMMMYGFVTGNTAIFIQGAIFDLADAVHDTALMVSSVTRLLCAYLQPI